MVLPSDSLTPSLLESIDSKLGEMSSNLRELNSMLIGINNNLLMLTTLWMLNATDVEPTEETPALADLEKIKGMKTAMVTIANILSDVT